MSTRTLAWALVGPRSAFADSRTEPISFEVTDLAANLGCGDMGEHLPDEGLAEGIGREFIRPQIAWQMPFKQGGLHLCGVLMGKFRQGFDHQMALLHVDQFCHGACVNLPEMAAGA